MHKAIRKSNRFKLAQAGRRQEAAGSKGESLYSKLVNRFERVGYLRHTALQIPLAVLMGVTLSLLLGNIEIKQSNLSQWVGIQPATAQFSIPEDASQRVYERLPNLPRENHYVSKETGQVDERNTLATRLMRYHMFVKRRPPMYRLDWKLTLADYIGANEYLVESQYPSANTLNQNPMESDRAAIEKLTRAERDALVNVLVSIFNPNRTQQTPGSTSSTSPSQPTPTSPNPRATPSLPQPGDAQLLMP